MAMLPRTSNKRKIGLGLKVISLLSVCVVYTIVGAVSKSSQQSFHLRRDDSDISEPYHHNGRHLLGTGEQQVWNISGNCTPAAINEFPPDGLTREQRQNGWIFLHIMLSFYLFTLLAIVCDDYFVPAIKEFCDSHHMREDIAGATLMAMASSSPELFINIVGTFVTEGDIGVGAIVGSAVFNILAVPACCGLFANMVLDVEWWPLSRDSMMYGISVILLITFLQDGKIYLYEALTFVLLYVGYIIVMIFNTSLMDCAHRLLRRCKRKGYYEEVMSETYPLLRNGVKAANGVSANGIGSNRLSTNGLNANGLSASEVHPHRDSKILQANAVDRILETEFTLKDCEDLEASTNLWEWPSDYTKKGKLWWVFTWPIGFVLWITTPDCRKYPRLYILTFIMCVVWIATSTYIISWLITVIGDTLNIPDSVMGLTFLAAGMSVPEAVSSVIVTNQGHGSMGLSSSIGSNTFDILLCLGLPWLIKTALKTKGSGRNWIKINSSGINYSAISLLSTLVYLYASIALNKFKLDWKVGLGCLIIYVMFLTTASLIELNVFFPVNLPTCDR